MKEELHLTEKDFRLDWYSGSGAGGQFRNKHQNCCRITHLESGLSSVGTSSRSRVANQKEAFNSLIQKVLTFYGLNQKGLERRDDNTEVIRNYHAVRNEVLDKESGLRLTYKEVVEDAKGFGKMIEARRKNLLTSDEV